MSKKNYLFLISFGVFVLVACSSPDDLITETQSTTMNESITYTKSPTEEEPSIPKEHIDETNPIDKTVLSDEIEPYIGTDFHEVEADETLFSISILHHTTVEILQQINNLGTSTDLRVGQLLRIPPLDFPLQQEVNISLTLIEDDAISNFDIVKTMDYGNLGGGRNLLFEIENTLYDLRLIRILIGTEAPYSPYVITTQHLGDLNLSGETISFLLQRYVENSFVVDGLRFIDDSGVERTFTFGWSPYDSGIWTNEGVWIISDATVRFWQNDVGDE